MKNLVLLCAVGLTAIVMTAKGQSSTCPVFGTDQSSSLSRSEQKKVFLNFESPSQCRGNVASYRYCSYNSAREQDPENFSYQAVLMVYRRNSSTSNIYTLVPGSVRELSLSHTEVNMFRCSTEPVQQFEIQENDIVGACVRDEYLLTAVDPLYLVGETTDNSTNFKTYQLNTFLQELCSNAQIETVDTGHSDFRQQSNLILHLYANIDASASCQVGSNPPATAPRTSNVEGTYLNTDNPVACATENTITSWHYCYYTSPLTAGQTYTMTVAVWRLDTPTNTYRLTAGSARTITLVHVATLAKIFCLEETLGSDESVFVSGGDVIGVVLPRSNPIPVVSSASSSSLMRHPRTASAIDLKSSALSSTSGSLHLYGNLEFIPVPTTLAPTTMEQPITTQTTMAETAVPTTMESTLPTTTTMAENSAPTTMEQPTTLPEEPAQTTMGPAATTMAPQSTTDQSTTGIELTTSMDITTELQTVVTTDNFATTEAVVMTTAELSATTALADTTEAQGTDEMTTKMTATTQQSSSGAQDTTPPSTESLTTSSGAIDDNQGGNTGVGIGDIAAIILSLVVMAVIVVSLVLFIIVYRQRRKKSATFSQIGVDNVLYSATNHCVNLNADPYEEGLSPYDFIPEDYTLPREKEKFEDYEEIQERSEKEIEANEGVYDIPVNPVQDYHECLDQVKQGVQPRNRTLSFHTPADTEAELYKELKNLKIPNIAGSKIEMGEVLGAGQFGTVYKGSWTVTPGTITEVAVKALQASVSMKDRIKFLQEGAIMAQFKHPNVVALYGVTLKNGQRMLVVELLSKGDLQGFLASLKPDPGELVNPSTPHLLLEFSQHIALGMSYLSSIGFVHRDLAARNILISDSNICKIADFGMSRDLEETDYYISSGGKIPFKWTAPEAIRYKKYSTASDVWSYGCVLYEIWSLGTKPFEGAGNVQVLRTLEGGGRLPPPPGCPKRVYEVMIQSWAKAPRDRPGFRDMLLSLLENKSVVLRVPPEDADSHPQAAVLGGPLEAGCGMYISLQNTYKE